MHYHPINALIGLSRPPVILITEALPGWDLGSKQSFLHFWGRGRSEQRARIGGKYLSDLGREAISLSVSSGGGGAMTPLFLFLCTGSNYVQVLNFCTFGVYNVRICILRKVRATE